MRIAYIVSSLAPLGPVIVVRNLVEGMTARGHECMVFYFDERKERMEFACPTKRISFWGREDFTRFDIVHTHSFRPMAYGVLHRRKNMVTTLHSYLFMEYRYSLGKVWGWMFGHVNMWMARIYNKVVVLSEDAKGYYSRWLPKEKLLVCYNGVDIHRTVPQELQQQYEEDMPKLKEFCQDATVLACICEMVPIKGVATVVKALSLLPENYRLLLIGDGNSADDLRHLAVELKMEERVLLLGERTAAYRYLPMADVYVMASYSEGFCLSLSEAALMGRNIVCADIPGMREKYTEEEVTYFEVGNDRDLARAVVEAQGTPKGERAREKALTFSVERMCESHERVYGGAVDNGQLTILQTR